MIIGYVLSTLYKRELRKQKEKQINKKPVSSKTSEEIFKELQKALREARSDAPSKPVIESKPKPHIQKTTLPPKSEPLKAKSKNAGKRLTLEREIMKSEAFAESARKPLLKRLQPSKLKQTNVMKENTAQENEHERGVSIDFDIKKAVLFSEILKRPQY